MLLLDTNVVSELRRVKTGKADPNFDQWAQVQSQAGLFVSVITIHELELGVLLLERRNPEQGAILRRWLQELVLPAFAGRILPLDTAVARRAATLHVPATRPANDAFIAATALIHSLTVVTRNRADFATAGVGIINPWDLSL